MMALGARRAAFESQVKRDAALARAAGGGGSGKKSTAVEADGGERVRWMEEDARELEAETAVCREGLAFFCVKK